MDSRQYEGRKRDHIRFALESAHEATGRGGFDRLHLVHEALPDFDFTDLSIQSVCLGARSATPFFVAAITAGHADAHPLNETLATCCEARGWSLGVGSQRGELEELDSGGLDHWQRLRDKVPALKLFANIGLSQLVSCRPDRLRDMLRIMTAQALVVHANPLQECLQPEGTPCFRGSWAALRTLCEELEFPVILKETGCGFGRPTLERLADIKIRALDVSGLGGTHWGRIEGARAAESLRDPIRAAAARTFEDWGESTVDSVISARQCLRNSEVWASGGVRSGLDAAKLLALGACQVGYAKPALEAALRGPESLTEWMLRQEYELRVALFCTGCETPEVLRTKEGVWRTTT